MLESNGEDAGLKMQLDVDLVKHKSDRDAASFLKTKRDLETNIGALEKVIPAIIGKSTAKTKRKTNIGALETPIPAIDKGMAVFLQMSAAQVVLETPIPAIDKGMGVFLQTSATQVVKQLFITMDMSAAQVVKQLSITMDMSGVDREMLKFLASKNAPETMKDEMATNTENAAIASFDVLVSAKTREIEALTASSESKTARSSELAVEHAELMNDLARGFGGEQEVPRALGRRLREQEDLPEDARIS